MRPLLLIATTLATLVASAFAPAAMAPAAIGPAGIGPVTIGSVTIGSVTIGSVTLAPVSIASAQDAEPTCRQVRPGQLVCSEQRIVGRRPQGFVLLARSRSEWQPPPLVRRDATDDVVRSVRREPF